VGGPKQELYIQTSNHEHVATTEVWKNLTIAPFWGFKPDGGVVIGEGLNMNHNFNIDVSCANITDITNNALLTWYNISIAELHACLAGKDVWKAFVAMNKSSLMSQLGLNESPLDIASYFNTTSFANVNFAKKLAALADVYVNDAFGVSHRDCASITEVPKYLPHYGGLLMEREVETIGHAMRHPNHPFAAIIGGAKVSTKLKLLYKLTERADYLILGGGLANTLLFALGYPVGKSLCERDMVDEVKKIVRHAKDKNTKIMLPRDVLVGTMDGNDSVVKKISEVGASDMILDIGPEAQSDYAKAILASKTLIWNGPVGYMENPEYARGTQFLYYTIAQNPHLVSIVGGGDTLAAIDKMEYLETITHISTGGGAMLEYIENGTLPGIEALK
jgi:3-phosphoglycerate kinase